MGTSVLHIKTEVECRVYLFDEEKGIAKPGTWFNLEVRKGEQDLLFVSTENDCVRSQMQYIVEENNCDYRIMVEKLRFVLYSPKVLELMQKSDQGDAIAQFNLGCCYFDGNGVDNDDKWALMWWRKSAELGYSDAQYNLGWCYMIGIGVEHDVDEALKWYRKAAEKCNTAALSALGVCYANGEGVGQNWEEAVKYWIEAANQGDSVSQCNLGWCYRKGYGVEQNGDEAAKWYRKAAEQGYPNAQYNLGWCYENGVGVVLSKEESFKWYGKAAGLGKTLAQSSPQLGEIWVEYTTQCNIGVSYDMENNVDQNWEEVVKWWQKAAEHSNFDAQYKLGWCYRNGKGVKQNWKEAMKWYRKAAEQGNVNAQNNLGECYCKIEKIDETKAVMWFTRAAEQGNADAQYNLGKYLNKGNNGSSLMTNECLELTRKAAEQGHIKAIFSLYCFFSVEYSREGEEEFVKWCRKAAELGLNDAQTELGYIYMNGSYHRHFGDVYWKGDLVERNLEESVKWWHKAAEQGDVNAQIALGYYYENDNWEESEKWYKKAAEKGRLPVSGNYYVDNNDNSRDTWDAMTDGMYGDMPDGFDGDYGFLGH